MESTLGRVSKSRPSRKILPASSLMFTHPWLSLARSEASLVLQQLLLASEETPLESSIMTVTYDSKQDMNEETATTGQTEYAILTYGKVRNASGDWLNL